jgi:hypothetical protein
MTEGQVERVCSALAAVIARRRAPKGPPPARPLSTAAGPRRAGP